MGVKGWLPLDLPALALAPLLRVVLMVGLVDVLMAWLLNGETGVRWGEGIAMGARGGSSSSSSESNSSITTTFFESFALEVDSEPLKEDGSLPLEVRDESELRMISSSSGNILSASWK